MIKNIITLLLLPNVLQSLVDREGLAAINIAAMSTKQAIDNKQFAEATELWNDTENIVEKYTHGVNFYNILKWGPAQKLEIKYQSAIGELSIGQVIPCCMRICS